MKLSKLLFFFVLFIGLASCQKDEDTTTSKNVENTPSALAANNNSSAGVYKGVLVGSSGYFKLSVKNGTEEVTCSFMFDGKEATLTSTSFANWTPGQAISNAVFSGTWDGKAVSLTFSCDANGANPQVSVTVPGHTVSATIYKETSTTLVKCYEGTYSGQAEGQTVTGTFNFIVTGTKMYGFRKDAQSSGFISGTISGSTLTLDDIGGSLTITDTKVSGTLQDNDGANISVNGQRSM
jgi:hypothetical protein